MKSKTLLLAGLQAVTLGLILAGCNKAKPKPIDPHSPYGVNLAIQALRPALSDAVKTNDLQFVHKQMYYIQRVAESLAFETQNDAQLGPEQKQQVADLLVKLKHVTEDTDNSSGRKHQEATVANLQSLFGVLDELEAKLAPKPGPK